MVAVCYFAFPDLRSAWRLYVLFLSICDFMQGLFYAVTGARAFHAEETGHPSAACVNFSLMGIWSASGSFLWTVRRHAPPSTTAVLRGRAACAALPIMALLPLTSRPGVRLRLRGRLPGSRHAVSGEAAHATCHYNCSLLHGCVRACGAVFERSEIGRASCRERV